MPSWKSWVHASVILFSCVLLTACRQSSRERTIVDLVEEKLISVSISGVSMDAVALHVTSISPEPLEIHIPAGTFFLAENPSVQNMVARHAASASVDPGDIVDIKVDAACASLHLAAPGAADTFAMVRASELPEMGKVIDQLNKTPVDYPVEQAAIWIVTDDASYDELGMLVGGSPFGPALIQEEDATRAMMLTDEAGVDIRRYSIWRDRVTLLSKVTEPDLVTWLGDQITAADPISTQVVPLFPSAGQPSSSANGEQISLWATSATADYELDPSSASQAAGAPDSSGCGQQPTAWASGDTNPGATLTLTYGQAVVPSRIVIYETYNPGAVFYVEVRDQFAGDAFPVYQGNAALNPECPHQLVIDVTDVPVGVNVVEITMDQSLGWTQIDAVELIGVLP